MRSRLIALVAGLLFLASVVGVAVVSRSADGGSLPKLALGATQQGEARADMAMMAPITYKLADGVAKPAEKAPAYRFVVGADQAKKIADALGVKGDVKADGNGWKVTDDTVVLTLSASGQWNLGVDCSRDSTVSSDGSVSCVTGWAAKDLPASGSGSVSSSGSAGVATEGSTGPPTTYPPDASEPGSVPPDFVCDMPECPPDSACIQACPEPRPLPTPVRPDDLPTKGQARLAAEKVLTALGFDPDQGSLNVEDGFSLWSVVYTPVIDGEQVPSIGLYFSIGPKGVIESGNGWVADREKLGDYPLVSLTRAVQRLNDGPMYGGGPIPMPAPMRAGAETIEPDAAASTAVSPARPKTAEGCSPAADGKDCAAPVPVEPECAKTGAEDGCPPTEPPVCIDGCEPPSFEPQTVTLTKVKVGLMLMPTFDEGKPAYLVPAYLFSNKEVTDLAALAIPDDLIEKAPQPEPGDPRTDQGKPEPMPLPSETVVTAVPQTKPSP